MSSSMEQLLQRYRQAVEKVSDGHMKRMILYGSYARGDNRSDSDIDIMILVDLADKKIKECEDKIFDVTYDFNEANETDIMPIVQNMEHFDRWKKAYVFYHNVEEEGVAI